jgi:hypothetical protein
MTPDTTPDRTSSVNRWRITSLLLAAALAVVLCTGVGTRQAAAGGASQPTAAPPPAGPASRLVQLGEVVIHVDHVRDALYNAATDDKGPYHTLVIHMDNDERITIARHNVDRAWADLTRYICSQPAPQ